MKYESLLAAADSERTSKHDAPIILRHRRHWAVLRYAAVIALAFGAGFFSRGRQMETDKPAPAPPGANFNMEQQYVSKYVKATQSFPESSSFSRALLMLARK